MAALERMHWLAATPNGFDLYADHNNLIFLLERLLVVPDLSQTSLRKVLRWAMRLGLYNYTCFHIKGADNVWADLFGQWSAPGTIRHLVCIPKLPSITKLDFEWPSLRAIIDTQTASTSHLPQNLMANDEVWTNRNGAIWILHTASDLQLRLSTIAHTGPSGHRGQSSTKTVLRRHYVWSTMTTDIRSFFRSCIQCLSTFHGEKVPHPFAPAVHGTVANDLLQFDYLEFGPSLNGEKYVLTLRDDTWDYKWLFAFSDTTEGKAANGNHWLVCHLWGTERTGV